MRSEAAPLLGRDHLAYRSYYFPVKVKLLKFVFIDDVILVFSFKIVSLLFKAEPAILIENYILEVEGRQQCRVMRR